MPTESNPLRELERLGQSIWLDSIQRSQILSGDLARLRDKDGISGETANPTIFEKAVGGSSDYDDLIRQLATQGKGPNDIYEAIATEDVRMAADVFRPVYDRTQGADGFVSIEVSPKLAYDTNGTIAEAKRFFREVNRPNIMIKIPGTKEGVPAIEECLYQGININITLLFSIQAYEQVAFAYVRALERRAAEGKPIDRVASVASFFVSRIDTLADKLVEEKLRTTTDPALTAKLESLGGKVAIANAKMAYESFKRIFGDARFAPLRARGARVQRPLWASTSTKNPHYSDVLYVEDLIGPDTINTLPIETIEAYHDHGDPHLTIEQDLEGARRNLQTLAEVGLSIDAITDQVLEEGVVKFDQSLDQLLQVIQAKRQTIMVSQDGHPRANLNGYTQQVDAALEAADKNRVAERVWHKDASLWKQDPAHQAEIKDRLGWLTVASDMRQHLAELAQFGGEIKQAKFKDVVLCGMGGSSLCVEVLNQTFGSARGYPRVHVLDTTDPATISHVEKQIDITKTLFIIASKSGGTVETTDQYKYFFGKVRAKKGDGAGENFVAVTDAGTGLEKTALENHFRRVFQNPGDIGGRYSALSYFGLVPAAAMGLEVGQLLDRAEEMARACGPDKPARGNPGVWLGTVLGTLAQHGRNKVTLVASRSIGSFGTWAEQLIAESTGKEGKGLIPVDREPVGAPAAYGDDRVFVYLRLASDRTDGLDRKVDALEQASQPVIRYELGNKYAMGAEFFRWEFAIAVAGAVIGIDAFDQPNVQESKDNTQRELEVYEAHHSFEAGPPAWEDKQVAVYLSQESVGAKSLRGNLDAFFKLKRPGDYLALMAYLEQTPENDETLQEARVAVRDALKIATTLGYGPRFLHSTGQLHKGGPNTVLALQVTAEDKGDVPIPGEPYTFGTLKHAQSLGDWQSLITHGRRALRIHLKKGARLELVLADVRAALYPGRATRRAARPPARKAAVRKAAHRTTRARAARRPRKGSRVASRPAGPGRGRGEGHRPATKTARTTKRTAHAR